ncbi:MAG: glycosyltransferase family 2 protein [Pseudomonadota bacterium]
MSNENSLRGRPTVSIGLPVFNGAAYVAGAIDSILAQTFEDFELVICDNASTDQTEVICRSYAAKDSRIRYLRNSQNVGSSGNFSKVFRESRGVYFKWHGHDDLIEPTYLEKLVEVLDADKDCVLAFPRTVMIDADGADSWCFLENLACDSALPEERLAAWLAPWKDDFINPVFGLMRREVVAKTDLMAPYLASDRPFMAHITLLGRSTMVPECLFRRRVHEEMSTKANPNKADLGAFITGKRPVLVFKQWRLLYEYLKLITRAPLETRSKLACYFLMLKWTKSRATRLLGELMLPLVFNGKLTRLGHWTTRLLRPVIKLP